MISIVCPTYNSKLFIERTLKSVISQTVKPLELIISDDGSTDGTLDFIKNFFDSNEVEFEYKIIQNPHKGPGASRNEGIRAARGDWIAFLDSDDIWYPDKISQIQNAINNNLNINFICNNELLVSKKNKKRLMNYSKRYNPNIKLFDQLYTANLFSTSAVACKRSLLINNSLFDEKLLSAQDYDLWLKLSPDIKLYFINKPLGEYIEREGNITSKNIFRRYKNEIFIASRYRDRVSLLKYLKRIIYIQISFLSQLLKKLIFPNG
jgi:glycosyltransferase involved in cell wall biosynthesis